MLVANLNDKRIEADVAVKGQEFRCPGCNNEVILKQGRIVIHHFAHKVQTNCIWSKGETKAHRNAKKLVAISLRARGLTAEIEFQVGTLEGDRRADVMLWSPHGQMVAFELQHSSISLDEIEARAKSYARANIAQMWIPFIRPFVWSNGTQQNDQSWFVEKYSARPFERWVHGLGGKHKMWMYCPKTETFWKASLAPHQTYVEESSWYVEGGVEETAGGFYKHSKRWRELTLQGPYNIDDLKIALMSRKAYSAAHYFWPSGKIARFEKS